MPRVIALMLLFALARAAFAAMARTYVLEPGVYDKIVIDDGEVWLGVYPAGGRAAVRECKLRVRRVVNPIGDESAATKIEARPDGPLFLLKVAPSVRPGNVTSLYTKGDESPATIAVTLQNKKYVLETAEEEEADGRRVSRLKLKLGGKEMLLGSCGARDSIDPVWAGDLDADGRLDVYVRIEHRNFAVEQLLFLSSADATGKALTARAAVLRIRKLE
jgi:hypothetical protein